MTGTQIKGIKTTFTLDSVASLILYIYLGLNSLCYIDWIPMAFVSYALYAFVGVSFVAMLLKGKAYIVPHVKWYAFFVLICFLSVLYSVSRADSIDLVSQQLKILIFLFCFSNFVDSKDKLRKVLIVLSISTLLLFLYLLRTNQLMVEDSRLGNELTGNANTFSSLFMMGAVSSVYFVLFSKKRVSKIVFLSIFVAQEFAMALAGSRKFFLLPIVIMLVLFLMSQDRKGRKNYIIRGTLVIGLFIGLYYAVFNLPVLYNSIGYRFEGLINGFLGTGTYDRSSQIRGELIESALGLWKNSPVFGSGIDTFKLLSGFGGYSHNNYVELLCGVGLIGFIAYYYYFVFLVKNYFIVKVKNTEKNYWLILGIALLVFDFGAVSYYSMPNQILMIMTTIAISFLYTEKYVIGKREDEIVNGKV